jgi:spore maturation protein CgeB
VRILVAGDWHSELHEEAVFGALRKLGHEVERFVWHRYFGGASIAPLTGLAQRVQDKFLLGPLLGRINRDFIAAAESFRPQLVFVYRGTHVQATSLVTLKRRLPGCVLLGYNNDDPFGPRQPRWLWRHFLRGLPHYDVVLAYRQRNLEDFSQHGAKRVYLLRSWFMPERNRPVSLDEADKRRFGCDVVFVGHYEDDGRLECLEEIARSGCSLRLFGPGYEWDPVIAKSRWLKEQRPVHLVWGDEYNKALCGAKIALCFFSRLNRDTYTRRCFEIPATGTMMLCEYSQDAAALFAEGRDADYFRNKAELADKLKRYLGDDGLRRSVAQSGLRRVHADGHDVVSRMRHLLDWLAEAGLFSEMAIA